MKSKYGQYYNITGLPNYFVIDKNGNIYDINPVEPVDDNFEQYIKQLK